MLKGGSPLLFLFFVFNPKPILYASVPGQNKWYNLFDNNGFVVQVALTPPKSGDCKTPYRFKYRKRGSNTQTVFVVWQIDFTGCDNNTYTKQVSYPIRAGERYQDWLQVETLDPGFAFQAKGLLSDPIPVRTSSVAVNSVQKKAPQKSVAPTMIAGDASVLFGETTRLSVSGGSLKAGSEWVWYEGRCGGKEIGRGAAISFSPGQKTIVYVRAEGNNDRSDCTSIIIEVDRNSVMPDRIIGDDHICVGEASKLLVQGGHLGLDAEWVWYTGDCGLVRVGTGKDLLVSPSENTRYFVRAEGRYNTTPCLEFQVEVSVPMLQPQQVRADKELVCEGELIQLWVQGGPGAADGQWHWSADICGGTPLHIGPKMVARVDQTTTFFVRGVSGCNQTDCRSVTVEVIPKLYAPGTIKSDFPVYIGEETTLSVVPNPLLGPDTRFLWFKNSCDRNAIGSGKSIVVKTRVPTTYFVKAITECNESTCQPIKIYPVQRKKTISSVPGRKFLVVGYGLGLSFKSFSAQARQLSTGTTAGVAELDLQNAGLHTDLSIHPIFTDHFGIGLHVGAGIGTTPDIFLRRHGAQHYSYSYQENIIGGEIFLGAGWAKLLLTQTTSVQKNDYLWRYQQRGIFEETTYKDNFYRQQFGIGLRLGRSVGTQRRTLALDVLYQTEKRANSPILFFRNPFEAKGSYWHGMTVALRAKNAPKAALGIWFPFDGEQVLKFEGKPLISASWNFINF